jgi:TRAP-type C4-dicarboxylate transport system permease small subunit
VNRLERTLADLFGFIFLGLSFFVAAEAIARKVFNTSLQGADEVGGYALAIGSAAGFALAIGGRNHIRVDIVHENFPRWLQSLMNWLASVAMAALAVLFVTICLRVLTESVSYGSTAQTPWATPLILPQGIWYAGMVLFALYAVGYAVRASYLFFSGRFTTLNAEFHPKSTKEEVKEELDDLAERSNPNAGARP